MPVWSVMIQNVYGERLILTLIKALSVLIIKVCVIMPTALKMYDTCRCHALAPSLLVYFETVG